MRLLVLLLSPLLVVTQQDKPQKALPPGISQIAGTDDSSRITYTLLTVEGKLLDAAAPQPATPPRLTAQCTQTAAGKQRFELQMDFGGAAPLAFYPPWHATKDDLYPPSTPGAVVTMEFLGYTKVKPVKRTWRYTKEQPEQLRYAAPGLQSSNMEEVMYYLQYMRSLPTLRLSTPGKPTVVFETQKWQDALRAEPLCHASGL